MDRSEPGIVYRLPGTTFHRDESAAGPIGLINLAVKSTGERMREIRTLHSTWRELETWNSLMSNADAG
jgi:hypothetical protein